MPDFFTNTLLSAPLSTDVRAQAMAVIARAEKAMPWAGSLQGPAALILNQGRWPMPAASADVTSAPEQQNQWKAFANAYSPITKAVLKGEMAAAKAEGVKLAANEAFWDSTYRVTLGVATLGVSELWAQLQKKLQEYRLAKAAAAQGLAKAATIVNDPKYANRIPASLSGQQKALEAELRSIDAAAVQNLGVLGSQAEVRAQAGLGAVPAFIAPVSYAVLGSVIAAFGAYAVKRIIDFKEKVADYAQDVLKAREAVDLEDYRAGRISADEYARRRTQNTKDAEAMMQAMGSSGFGDVAKYAMIAAGIVTAGILIYKLVPKRQSA